MRSLIASRFRGSFAASRFQRCPPDGEIVGVVKMVAAPSLQGSTGRPQAPITKGREERKTEMRAKITALLLSGALLAGALGTAATAGTGPP